MRGRTTVYGLQDIRNGAEASLMGGGRIGGAMMGKLLGGVEDFAAVTGETSDKAAEELNRMFSDPAKGAEELATQMNLLSAAQRHEIENLEAQGQFGEAQEKLYEALSQRIGGATQELGFFATAWESVKKAASDAWDALARRRRLTSRSHPLSSRSTRVACPPSPGCPVPECPTA